MILHSIGLHIITPQKIVLFAVAAARTSGATPLLIRPEIKASDLNVFDIQFYSMALQPRSGSDLSSGHY
jgi:hypothetical protein